MWSSVLSYFWKSREDKNNENDLSLAGACNILSDAIVADKPFIAQVSDAKSVSNLVTTRKGIITECEGDNHIIDNLYAFCSNTNIPVGSKVSYSCFIHDNQENVVNVRIIQSDWDSLDTNDALWNCRIIVCKVETRENRNLLLSPGNIKVDLNNVSTEFLPIVGDWLELDVKCTINENAIDLSGDLLEINKISPVRAHIESGTINKWDPVEKIGVVNKNIFFNENSLSCGYLPVVGDKITAEIIESDQNMCCWRAIKIIPEYILAKADNSNKPLLHLPEFRENYPGLHINSVTLTFNKLENKPFIVTISNKSEDNDFVLQRVEFFKTSSQCRVLDKIESNILILRNTSYNISCECVAKNIGRSNELLWLSFQNFNIGKWIYIEVDVDFNKPVNSFERRTRTRYQQRTENELVKGQKVCVQPRFISGKLPLYTVPKKIFDIVTKYNYCDLNLLVEELKFVKPSLYSNLAYTNYEDKFHALLHLDEIESLMMISNYDQEKACFIQNEEYLMLEIENLSERRPSLVIGDKIIASDPLNKNQLDFEGYIHKVGAKHVYIKFSQLFHSTYDGEDYSIKIVPSRVGYRKLHHAVYLAVRNLGKDILFPTKVEEKNPQITVEVDMNDSSSELDSSINRKKRMNPHDLLQKLTSINKNEQIDITKNDLDISIEEKPQSNLKLEWYNKLLNSKQKDAVINILLGVARPLPYIIFGPPGTGKTITIVEVVLQIIRLIPQSRLLITTPSNSAADLIALRLIGSGVLKPGDMVRLVSYNYALSDLIPMSLVPYCATGSLAKEGTNENEMTHSGIQYDCGRGVLGRHRITISTCSSSGQLYSMGFPKGHFTHIIVDEAAQTTEPDVLIPLALLDKYTGQIILAGDPMQLGSVVQCKIAGECGLNESYLERMVNRFPYIRDPEGFPDSSGYDPRLVTKLLHNYRSLPIILKLCSSLFYNDELIATIDDNSSKEAIYLHKLEPVLPKTSLNEVPCVVFHGVIGVNYQSADSPSWYNPHEAAQVFYYINELYRLGTTSSQIGIITPYIKQVKEIRALLKEAEFDIPKIGTVEEFQGQEFDVIILSTVRSCQEFIPSDIRNSLGFVSSPKRLNVAISRTKALLIVIGNPNLLCLDNHWRSVIKYCFENGCYTGCDYLF